MNNTGIFRTAAAASPCLALLLTWAAAAEAETITTVAGGGATYGDGGLATSAQLSSPQGIAVDAAGDAYLADQLNCVMGKANISTMIIHAVAGNRNFGWRRPLVPLLICPPSPRPSL